MAEQPPLRRRKVEKTPGMTSQGGDVPAEQEAALALCDEQPPGSSQQEVASGEAPADEVAHADDAGPPAKKTKTSLVKANVKAAPGKPMSAAAKKKAHLQSIGDAATGGTGDDPGPCPAAKLNAVHMLAVDTARKGILAAKVFEDVDTAEPLDLGAGGHQNAFAADKLANEYTAGINVWWLHSTWSATPKRASQ